jgi:rhodanese-related sulfurtransferase
MNASLGRALRWAAPILILCLLLGGCNLFRRHKPAQPYKKLSPPVAYEIMRDSSEILVLDLRRPEEYNGETGHIRRARNLPLAKLPFRLLEIASYRDGTVLVYCHESTDCAVQGTKLLLASGFESVILMDGGIEQWIRGGFKTVLPANLAGKRDPDEEPLMPARPEKKKSSEQLEVPVTPPPMPPPPSSPPP